MSNRYNFFYFEAEFKKYLVAGKAEASTVKNYLSDLHYFFSWLQNEHHITDLDYPELPDVFSNSLIHAYYSYLSTSSNSDNTTIRRLATLRKFFTLCVNQRWLTHNPAVDFHVKSKGSERDDVVESYKQSLMGKNVPTIEIERHINVIRDLVCHY